MCGIVGILELDGGSVSPRLLARMGDALIHRGPDGEGTFADGPVGFHHKRLAIIDPAAGRQPMTRDGVTIVLNGEIYNYLELRDELRGLGHEFRTRTDTEVLLAGYLQWGSEVLSRLNGMFAFLVWDSRSQRLLAARDHFGIKPLYYHATARRLMFASEIKALWRHPELRAEANDAAINDYLWFQYPLGDATLFQGVRKLLPGHLLEADLATGRHRITRYWEPRFQADRHHTEEFFLEQLRYLLRDAVGLQMRSDVPVGCYLSGGFDSSLITALAAPLAGDRLKTFTGAFREGREFNELEHARALARHVGAESFEIWPTQDDFVELLPALVYYMDEPAGGPGLFPQYMVSRRASREVKVVLGGQGGDEIFGGYARYLVAYFEQALKGAIFETNEEQEHLVSLRSIVPNLPALQQYGPMMQHFFRTELFEPMDRRYFRLIDRSVGTLECLTPERFAGFDPDAVYRRFQEAFNHPETVSYYNKMTHFDLIAGLPALLQVEDRASMAASVESRVPLLDRRIVELVASMPPALKFKGGELKYILKRAVKDLLPPAIAERKDKMGFPVPLHLWSRSRCRELFEDILLSRAARERGLFDPVKVEAALRDERAFSRRLWGMINLELWYRTFIDCSELPDLAPTRRPPHAAYAH